MRIPFIAGNWKMNMLRESSLALVRGLIEQLPVNPTESKLRSARRAFTCGSGSSGPRQRYRQSVRRTCITSRQGAFTGELSAAMLRDVGCSTSFSATANGANFSARPIRSVNQKIDAALAPGLTPIVCVGELWPSAKPARPQALSTRSATVRWPA